ncbi:MAG: hypothetical protein K2H26_00880 [Ruminococcus sp.]|nr:hypothetical protein [Ruminococcus sp.]
MKKITVGFITVLTALIVAVCIHSKHEETRIHNAKIELGKKNACQWFERKYGIEVEAVKALVLEEDDIFSSWEGDNVWVIVREGDKEYNVEISGVEENADGTDDYQAEEIEKALIDMIKADMPTDFEYDFHTDTMRNSHYKANSKSSLETMLQGNDTLDIYCVNTDFEELPVFEFLRRNITDCTFYSFSSQEILDDFMKDEYYNIDYYAPFITNYRVLKFRKRDNECREYNLKNYGDLLYYVPHEKIDGEFKKGFYEISESEIEWIGNEYEIVSKAYGIDEKTSRILVWFPIPEDKKDKDFYFAYSYYRDYDKKTVRKTEECHIVGNYAVKTLYSPIADMKIAFLSK